MRKRQRAGFFQRHGLTIVFALFWLSALGFYIFGYVSVSEPPPALRFPQIMAIALAAIVPIGLMASLSRYMFESKRLALSARRMEWLADRVTTAPMAANEDLTGRAAAVRHELDLLSQALDSTLARVAAIEEMLENNVAAVERAGSSAQIRAQMIRDLLQSERAQLTAIADTLSRSATAVVEAVGNGIEAARETNSRAIKEIASAEEMLARQIANLGQAAETSERAMTARLQDLEAAAVHLEESASRNVVAADGLTARLSQQHGTLSGAGERLQELTAHLESVMRVQADLLARVEQASGALSEDMQKAMGQAVNQVSAAMENIQSRASAAGSTLRSEADAAAMAGSNAAQAIERAARAARDASEGLRAAVGAEMAALTDHLGKGVRSLDDVAITVGQTLSSADQSSQSLAASLDATIRNVEEASRRLFTILEGIESRSAAAKGTLDEAAIEMEQRLARVPELAAEHASRLSSLLEDQAGRMGALAQSLATRTKALAETQPSAPIGNGARHVPAAAEDATDERSVRPQIVRGNGTARSAGPARRFGLRLRRGNAEPGDTDNAPAPLGSTTEGNTQAGASFWGTLFSRIDEDSELPPQPDATPREQEGLETESPLETLNAIAIDLDRLLEEDPPVDLWKRYRSGDRSVFARRLVTLKDQGLEERIRRKYDSDFEFREHAERYLERCESLIANARSQGDQGGDEQTHLGAHTGRLYELLKGAVSPARNASQD